VKCRSPTILVCKAKCVTKKLRACLRMTANLNFRANRVLFCGSNWSLEKANFHFSQKATERFRCGETEKVWKIRFLVVTSYWNVIFHILLYYTP
jgi:hypothetical protein